MGVQGRGLVELSGLAVAPADQMRDELGCGSDFAAGERDMRLGTHELTGPDSELTGVPFNDAYRYMDWLLTVPLLLIEILLVMKLDEATYSQKARTLGVGSALMIVSGYYGELTVTGDLTPRWICWFISMAFFLYIVQELLV